MRLITAIFIVAALAGCAPSGGLAPGLSARMDQPSANLDTSTAINLINSLRSSRGLLPLREDPALNSEAAGLAGQYATNGRVPSKPADAKAIRVSAGYKTFAETFSGWRASTDETAALVDPSATTAGVGVAYNANSNFGTHWVLLINGN